MILKHRDREFLRFEWLEPQGVRVLSVNEAEKMFLPLEMHGESQGRSVHYQRGVGRNIGRFGTFYRS